MAAVLFRQGRPEQAELGDLGHEFLRETALVKGIANDRKHVPVGESGHGVLHRALSLSRERMS